MLSCYAVRLPVVWWHTHKGGCCGGVGNKESVDSCFGSNLFASFPSGLLHNAPDFHSVLACALWRMLAADSGEALGYFLIDLQTCPSLLGYFILNHHGERCLLLYSKQFECCACKLPSPCHLTPHPSFDFSEFSLSHPYQSTVLLIACSSAAVGRCKSSVLGTTLPYTNARGGIRAEVRLWDRRPNPQRFHGMGGFWEA